MEEFLNVKEVAQYLRISESELRKLMSKGEISFFEVGTKESKRKVKRFRKSDILTFINENFCRKD